MDVYNLATQTQGANYWTLRQLQSREVADEHRKEFDVNHKVLRTWEDKVRSALIHAEQQTAFLSRDGALRGPVDPLVQQHLLEAATSRNRVYSDESRRAGRHGGKGSSGGGKGPRRPPRGPRSPPTAPAKASAKDKRKSKPAKAGGGAAAPGSD